MAQFFGSLIIGVGKGGKTLAANLVSIGLKVALVEKSSKVKIRQLKSI